MRWQARLEGGDDDRIAHLLAIHLAWEWLLHDDAPSGTLARDWAAGWAAADAAAGARQQTQHDDWVLQSAVELAYQEPLIAALNGPAAAAVTPPAVQALFCIDVRSEVLRRGLEAVSPAVQTRGFAAFLGLFGLVIACLPIGSALQWRQRWAEFRAAPASAFSFVESMGLLYGAKLLADALPSTASTVANRRYGSGNKLLPNAVGGHLRVLQGNGGDLRIGLPMQSLHDGQRLRHTPLRLLRLLRICTDTSRIERWARGHWVAAEPARPLTALGRQ